MDNFINRKDLDLINVPKGTQVLMLTENNKYILGTVRIEKSNNKKYVSNDYYAKSYCILW